MIRTALGRGKLDSAATNRDLRQIRLLPNQLYQKRESLARACGQGSKTQGQSTQGQSEGQTAEAEEPCGTPANDQ